MSLLELDTECLVGSCQAHSQEEYLFGRCPVGSGLHFQVILTVVYRRLGHSLENLAPLNEIKVDDSLIGSSETKASMEFSYWAVGVVRLKQECLRM